MDYVNLAGHGGKRSTPHCGSEGDHPSPVGTEGHCKLESYDFGAERKRLKSPDRCLFNRAERVMDGRGLTGCRSAADAGWQSSDSALPIRASLLTACPAEVLPGVLCVRGVQREFEDLLAVLIFSPVRWV